MGKPNRVRAKQTGPVERPLENTVEDILRNSGGNGRTMGGLSFIEIYLIFKKSLREIYL
jgi:hypothetical protein